MANRIILNLRFTTEKGMGLSLKATVKGTSKANYKKVQGLRNPDYSYWDNKSQCFNQPSLDAIHNNKVLQEMRDHYQKLLDTGKIQDGKQLFSDNPLEERQEKSSVLTLGAYLQRLIDSMKSEKVQMPSKNYQCYITLLHKLELEKNVIEVPLKDVDDTQFMKFSNFVLNELNGVNYMGLMKKFHATIVKARKEKLTVHVLDYPYREKAPRNIIKAAEKAQNGVDILTVKQYKKFVEMDLNEVPHGNKMQVKYMELYRDFCVFIYEMKMRPCDVVKLNVSDIIKVKLTFNLLLFICFSFQIESVKLFYFSPFFMLTLSRYLLSVICTLLFTFVYLFIICLVNKDESPIPLKYTNWI